MPPDGGWYAGRTKYHFSCKAGSLVIEPHRNLPVVQLSINGKHCASYPSAAMAATAVHLGRTHHKELDELAGNDRPAKLQDWEQVPIK